MPRVRMFFSEFPACFYVTFTEAKNATQLGPQRKYRDSSRLFDILRAARAPVEDHQLVECALLSRRPGSVILNLTRQQYRRLKYGSASSK